MKKFIIFWSMAMLALCVGFSSCSKDDEGNDFLEWDNYVEVVINGETYKNHSMMSGFGLTGHKLYMQMLMGMVSGPGIVSEFKIPDADISFMLSFYINETDLKTATTGEYRIGANYSLEGEENFDFHVIIEPVVSGSGYYDYVSGEHTVSNIKRLSVDTEDYTATYLVEGTFSVSAKNDTNGKTLNISGKYWTKLDVNTERN